VALDAKMTLRPPDTERIRFSRSAVAPDGSWHGTVVDVSDGGLGLICELYVPVWSHIHVHIGWPNDPDRTLFAADCLARRVQMIDRRPAYLVGLQYDELSDDQHAALEQFMTLIDEGAG
jgi:hypothetical protein